MVTDIKIPPTALEAWPGMIEAHHPRENQHAIILPLPTETDNDKA